jgi:hypothetical protein
MPYCITLRARTDKNITGWYDGSDCRWSTDQERQKLFDNKRDAKPVRHELRELCPRNADIINIEPVDIGFGPRRRTWLPPAADRRGGSATRKSEEG